MGPWYYEVVSFDGDYVNLRRTDIAVSYTHLTLPTKLEV